MRKVGLGIITIVFLMLSVSIYASPLRDAKDYIEEGELEDAYDFLEEIAYENRDSDIEDIFGALLALTEIDLFAVNSDLLLQHAVDLLEISVDEKDAYGEMMANYYLANLYYLEYDDEKAFDYLYDMLDIAENEKDDFGIGLYYFFMGKSNYEYGNDEDAISELEDAVFYFEDIDQEDYLWFTDYAAEAEILLEIMDAEDKRTDEQIVDALSEIYNKSISVSVFSKCNIDFNLGTNIGYYESYELGISRLNELKATLDYFDAYDLLYMYYEIIDESLAEFYYELGDYENMAQVLYGGAFEEDVEEDVESTENFNDSLRYLENKRLLDEAEQKRFIIIGIGIFTGLLLIALFVIYKENRKIKTLNKQIYEKSIRDGLTGLYNHSKIIETFTQNPELYGSIAVMDIDNFKRVNDTYGHLKGDIVLKKIAEILETVTEGTGRVGRYGGEEFLVLYYDKANNEAMAITEEIRQTIEEVKWDFCDHPITVSIGLHYKEDNDFNKLFKNTDKLLYQAKNSGKNRICAKHIDPKEEV